MHPPDPLQVWLTIGAVAGITLCLRLSFILLLDRLTVPAWFRRALRFVPAAVLSALIWPAVLGGGSQLHLSWGNERLLAGIVAAVVAGWSRNPLLTLSVGMGTLWVATALLK